MNSFSRRQALALAASPLFAQNLARGSADVVVYGATPGGIAAAVNAAQRGRSVVLCDAEDHIGGIVSNGLTNADIGKRQAVGGFFYEFTQRVVKHYEEMDRADPAKPNVKLCRDGYWYEASAAERIFQEMLREQGSRVRLLLGHELQKAELRGNQLVAIQVRSESGAVERLAGQVFVDATYEGDLAAMAGAPFRTGRESRAEFNEPHAGKIYMRFRETEILPGSTGEADDATQAYCFRFHVTNVPDRRVAIAKPEGFNRDDYRWQLQDIREGKVSRFRDIIQVYAMPNGRFELNSDHVNPQTGAPRESLDLAEECWPWPTASRAERKKIYRRYLTHNVGLIWLLQNDPEVPESLRNDARQWGWHKDEWVNNGHVPRQVYVRQGRRIEGEYMLTQRDADIDPQLGRTAVRSDSIAVIEWAFDPHGHHKYDPAHPGVREGYFFVLHEPFQVPYGVIVPKKIDGLLVPVACSCSHVAYNALRMEPVFMALGEAAGLAAHLSIKHRVPLRRVPTADLQVLLVEQNGVITFFEDLPFTHVRFPAMQWLGARGLHRGYVAEAGKRLTRSDALERLRRIMQFSKRRWSEPPLGDGNAAVTRAELASWLGIRLGADSAEELSLGAFSDVVYAWLRPRVA